MRAGATARARPAALREAAPPFWHHLAAGALHRADVHAARNDRVPALANAAQAVTCTAQGRLAARGEWALNDKRIVQRAGLSAADGALAQTDLRQALADLPRLLSQWTAPSSEQA